MITGAALGLLVLFLALVLGIWLLTSLLGLIILLLVAAFVGWAADKLVPGRLPSGWLGAIVAGLLGSFIGEILLGDKGPEISGIAIVPSVIGAVLVALTLQLFGRSFTGSIFR